MSETNLSHKANTVRIVSKTDIPRSSLDKSWRCRLREKSLHVKLALAICTAFALSGCVGVGFVDSDGKIAWATPTQSVRSLNSNAPTIAAPAPSGPSTQTITLDSADPGAVFKPKPLPVIVGTTVHSVNSPTLRCWQEGRLVVDQAVKALPKTTSNVFTIQDRDTGHDIYTFDLKNALCIVS